MTEKRIKIAITADVISQHSGARAPIRFAQGLADLGYEVHFLCQNVNVDQELKKDLEKRGITIVYFAPKLPVIGRFTMAYDIYRYLKSQNFDLLFLQSAQIHYMSYIFINKPKLRTYYGTQLDLGLKNRKGLMTKIPQSWLQAYIKLREGSGLRTATKILSISDYLIREAQKLYGLTFDNVYLGVDDMSHLARKLERKDNTVRIMSVSRIVPYKGFHRIIEAFKVVNKEYPAMRLDIIGSSPIPEYLDYLNTIKNDNVFIHINISDSDLADFYNQADIYTTADSWVPWSLTPLEASFFSLPLLGLDYGAMNEIITPDENGLLAKDDSELTAGLKTLVKDKKLREKLGAGALQRVKTFTWESCCKQYDIVIKEMTKKLPTFVRS